LFSSSGVSFSSSESDDCIFFLAFSINDNFLTVGITEDFWLLSKVKSESYSSYSSDELVN
jgi:hypothetical protein